MIIWKEPIPGNKDDEQIWYSSDDKYRITWRSKFMDVNVVPKFIACVMNEQIWDIISRHNKLTPAQKACTHHATQQKKLQKLQKIEPPKKKRKLKVKRGVTIGERK